MNPSSVAPLLPGLKPQAGTTSVRDASGFHDRFADVLSEQADHAPSIPEDHSVALNAKTNGVNGVEADLNLIDHVPEPGNPEEDDALNTAAHAFLPGIAIEIAQHARAHAASRNTVDSPSATRSPDHRAELPQLVQQGRHYSNRAETATDNSHKAEALFRVPEQQADINNPQSATKLKASLAHAPATHTHTDARRIMPTTTEPLAHDTRAATGKAGLTLSESATLQHNTLDTITTTRHAFMNNGELHPAAQGVLAHASNDIGMSSMPAVNPFAPTGTPVLLTGQIATAFHQPNWQNDLNQQVVMLARDTHNGTQTAELRLDPPELGPLRISISLTDGMASALFVSSHPSVRQAIEAALPQLGQQLAQAGIALGEAQVGEHGQHAGFEANEHGQGLPGPRHASSHSPTPADSPRDVAHSLTANRLVDTFA